MVVNTALSFVPTDVTAVMITTEMSAAISPYSMALAPELSYKKRRKKSSFILMPPALLSDPFRSSLKSYTRADARRFIRVEAGLSVKRHGIWDLASRSVALGCLSAIERPPQRNSPAHANAPGCVSSATSRSTVFPHCFLQIVVST